MLPNVFFCCFWVISKTALASANKSQARFLVTNPGRKAAITQSHCAADQRLGLQWLERVEKF